MDPVLFKSYNEESLPINKKEILRYAGAMRSDDNVEHLLEECLKEADNCFSYKVCFKKFKIKINAENIDLGFCQVKSGNLQKNLMECKYVVAFAATIGPAIDRLIKRYVKISPAKALMFQAIGSERIEAVCDLFSKEAEKSAKQMYLRAHPRYSPGYGDLNLTIQKELFSALDCTKKIGITLNESFLISPSKSVTAFIGLSPLK